MAVAAVFGLGLAAPAFGAVSLTAPAAGVSNNATPTFAGTASTSALDQSTVTVKVYAGPAASGTPAQILSAPVTPMTGAWTVTASPALGDNTYTAQAEQAPVVPGAAATSLPTTFTIDTTPPAVSLTSPADQVRRSDPTPTFSGAAGNAPGDAAAVSLQVHAGSGTAGPVVETLLIARSGGAWSGDASPPLPDGTYTALATQGDGVGNNGSSNPHTFTIDTTAPNVSLDAPAANSLTADRTPIFRGSAGAAAGDSSTVRVNVYRGSGTGGTTVQSLQTGRSSGAWSVAASSGLADGTYTARAEQVDDLAHRGVSDTHTFTIATGFNLPGPRPPVASAALLSPFPIVRIAGRLTHVGVTLRLLSVQAPAGSKIEVSCRGKSCPRKHQSLKAPGRAGAKGLRSVSFRRFARALRAGVVLEIRVTRSGRIGKYTRFVIRRNKTPRRTDSCLRPGKSKPSACPTS